MTRRSISATRRLRIFEAAGGKCHICGQKIQGLYERWDVEHIIPLALGGEDEDRNMAPAHVACHSQKTREEAPRIAKSRRMRQRSAGIPRTVRRPIPGSRRSKFKRKISGEVVKRDG